MRHKRNNEQKLFSRSFTKCFHETKLYSIYVAYVCNTQKLLNEAAIIPSGNNVFFF